MAQEDYVLNEFALAYLSALARVLAKVHKQQMPANHQEILHTSLKTLFSQLGSETDFDTHFVVMGDLSVVCLMNDQNLFLEQTLPHLELLLQN